MKQYIQNIEDALFGIPEKFRLEKKTITANIQALITELKNEQGEDKGDGKKKQEHENR